MNQITETVNRHVVFTGPLPTWLVTLLAVAGLAAVWWLLRRELGHRIRRPRTRVLFGLRAVIVLLLALLLAQPVLFTRRERRRPAPVLVLTDRSASMLREDAWTDGELLNLAAVLDLPGLEARPTLPATVAEVLAAQRRQLEQARNHWRDVHDQLAQGLPWGRPYAKRLDELNAVLNVLSKTLRERGEALNRFESRLLQDDTTGMPAYRAEPFAAMTELRDAATRLGARTAAIETPPSTESAFQLWQETNDLLAAIDAAIPLWREYQQAADEAFLAVLPAASRRGLEELGESTRFNLARAVAARMQATAPGNHILDFAGPNTLAPTEASAQTDLYALLAGDRHLDDNVSGVLVFSDGGQNLPPRPEILERLHHRRIPLIAVGVGSSQPLTDAAILDYRLPRVLPARERVTATVRLKTAVPEETALRLQLLAGEEIVAERTVPADGNPTQEAALELRTPSDGTAPWTLRVLTPEPDDVPGNDAVRFAVDLRDRDARVLIVALQPRWDLVYLMRQLDRLPCRVDTVFWGETAPDRELRRGAGRGKIPESADDFSRYDLVVLDGQPFPGMSEDDAAAIITYLGAGGRLLLTVDPAGASYLGTLPALGDLGPTVADAQVLPLPGVESYPVLALDADVTRSQSIWRALPPLRHARALPADQLSLLAVDNGPALTVTFLGRGRAYLLGATELYALRAWEHGAAIDRFLEALLADALVSVPEEGPVLYPAQPIAGAPLHVVSPNGGTTGGSWQVGDASQPLAFRAGPDGSARARIENVPAGTLTVTTPGGASRTRDVVSPLSSEDIYVDLDTTTLTRFAAGAGGDYVSLADLPARLRALPQHTARDVDLSEQRLWHWPLFLLLVAGLLTVDWVLRRLEGLVL